MSVPENNRLAAGARAHVRGGLAGSAVEPLGYRVGRRARRAVRGQFSRRAGPSPVRRPADRLDPVALRALRRGAAASRPDPADQLAHRQGPMSFLRKSAGAVLSRDRARRARRGAGCAVRRSRPDRLARLPARLVAARARLDRSALLAAARCIDPAVGPSRARGRGLARAGSVDRLRRRRRPRLSFSASGGLVVSAAARPRRAGAGRR